MEPHWTSYVGMGAGAIGAITGIAGAIMGYVSNRRVTSLKTLDLRLDLKRARNDAHKSLVRLNNTFDEAKKSRPAIASATHRLKSGMMIKWGEQIEYDGERINLLSENVPSIELDYESFSPKKLEATIIELHRTQGQIEELTDRYEQELERDDEDRRQLREDRRARFPQ